eukprot:COSAG01_NODE_1408_length_10418_cov_25.577478_7_plen_74_part_00
MEAQAQAVCEAMHGAKRALLASQTAQDVQLQRQRSGYVALLDRLAGSGDRMSALASGLTQHLDSVLHDDHEAA